jgi:hypothetical protein
MIAAPEAFYKRQELIKASPLYPQIQYMNSQLNQMQEGTPQYEALKAKLFAMQDQAAGGMAPQQQMPQIPGRSSGIEGLLGMLVRDDGLGERSPGQYPDTYPVPSTDDMIIEFPVPDRPSKTPRGRVPDYIKTAPPKPPRPPILDDIFGPEGRIPPRDDRIPMMRTNDFQDRNGNGVDDRDERGGRGKFRRIPSRRIKDSYRQRGGLAGRIAQLTEQMRGREDRPMPRGGMFRDLMRRVQSERYEPRMQAPLQNMEAPPPEQYFAERNRRAMKAPDMEQIRRQLIQNIKFRDLGI